jgi:hypothetical protein
VLPQHIPVLRMALQHPHIPTAQQALRIRALRIRALRIQALRIQALRIQALRIQALHIQALHIQALHIRALHIRALHIRVLHIRVLRGIRPWHNIRNIHLRDYRPPRQLPAVRRRSRDRSAPSPAKFHSRATQRRPLQFSTSSSRPPMLTPLTHEQMKALREARCFDPDQDLVPWDT